MPDEHRRPAGQFDRALRIERITVRLRWGATLFAVVQILTYYRPHPPGVLPVALVVTGLLAVGNAVLHRAVRRAPHAAVARPVSLAALALDGAVVMAFVFLYTFDPETAMWAVVYILPLEGALRFQLTGALGTMAGAAVVYTAREVYGALALGNPFYATSISFRMGIGFIIAVVAGSMASGLVRERERVEQARARAERSAAELEERNAELAAASRVKDDFVAMTNHEVRTPLTTILGYTSTLRLHWDALDDSQRRDFVLRVEEQGQRLLRLVEGLLMLSTAHAGGLRAEMAPVRVREVVAAALGDAGRSTEDVDVRCPGDPWVLADPLRLRQVLVNYLANALKYGREPLRVDVHAGDEHVEIAVVDHGHGVPEEFVSQLFDRFTRASNGAAGGSGAGLGLAIVRALLEAQGGAAWYEPNDPSGARFCARLPRVATESAEGAEAGQV